MLFSKPIECCFNIRRPELSSSLIQIIDYRQALDLNSQDSKIRRKNGITISLKRIHEPKTMNVVFKHLGVLDACEPFSCDDRFDYCLFWVFVYTYWTKCRQNQDSKRDVAGKINTSFHRIGRKINTKPSKICFESSFSPYSIPLAFGWVCWLLSVLCFYARLGHS